MRKLNPITTVYLKILELVSVILISLGEKLDPLFSQQRLTPEHLPHLRSQESWWSHNNQCSESPQSDSESLSTNTPDYYFDRYDPRSLFHDHIHDSDDWYDTFTGPEIHHGPDPFDSY